MWILGNPVKIEGDKFTNERAIFISNHASPLDIFPIMWLTPTGTVGIAKKEVQCLDALRFILKKRIICMDKLLNNYITELNNEFLPVHIAGGFTKRAITGYLSMQVIWYPLFGQLYVLANHLHRSLQSNDSD